MKTVINLITFAFLLTCLTPTFASDSLTIEGYLSARHIKAEKMAEGIFCTIYTEGVGKVPKQGEYVKIRYVGKLLNGNVFDKSPEEEPYIFKLGNGQVIAGWNKAIEKLKIGTKTTLYIPSNLAYGSIGVGNVIPPNAPLAYDIELLEVLNQAEYDAIIHKLEDKQRKIFDNRAVLQFETDKKHINDYALLHRLKVTRTESGLSHIVTKEGKGMMPKKNSKISLHYSAMLLSDRVFEDTKDKLPKKITLGDENLMPCLEEGLKYFNEGAEGYLLIPSKLALATMPLEENGKMIVPPNSVLVYKIQIVDIQ